MIQSFLKTVGRVLAVKRGFLFWTKQTMSSPLSTLKPAPTAGIIVIGDEILKGQVKDSNSHFIASKLYNLGVRVMKVSVIGDDINEISSEVRKFSQMYTYVITSGGIGPTHDDVTFEGVARAFEESTFPHPELVQICFDFFKTTDLTSPAMKLACVPQSSKLKYGFDPIQNCKAKYPNVSVKNVFIFPGVPPLLEKSFTMLCEELFGGSGSKFHKLDIFINDSEVSIADQLSKAVNEFPTVVFGSYPQHNNRYYRTKITIEADNPELLSKANHRLKELLPEGVIVEIDDNPLQSSFEKIEALGAEVGMDHVRSALQELLQTITSFSPSQTALCMDISLSGLATLHLLHAVQRRLQRTDSLTTALVKNKNTAMLDQFVEDTASRYKLHIIGEPSDLRTVLSNLCSSREDLKLLIDGCCYNPALLQEVIHFSNGCKSVVFLSPVSSWTSDQLLDFITKLNLPLVDDL